MRGAICVLIRTVRTRNVSLYFAVCGATELHCSMLQTFQFATVIIITNIIIGNIIVVFGAADVPGKCVAPTPPGWFVDEIEAQAERERGAQTLHITLHTSRCNANYEQSRGYVCVGLSVCRWTPEGQVYIS